MTTVAQRPSDLFARYDRSFIKFSGKVFFCIVGDGEEFDDDNSFRLYYPSDMGGSPVLIVDPYDDRIDTKSVELGYVNTPNGCRYVSRGPVRQWRQGVAKHIVESQIGNYAESIFFENTLNGIFPSVNEALNYILDWKFPQIAVTRDLMLSYSGNSKGIDVFFRETHVGDISKPREDVTIEFFSERLVWAMRPHLVNISWRLKDE